MTFTFDPNEAEGVRAARVIARRAGWARFINILGPVILLLFVIELPRFAGSYAAGLRQYWMYLVFFAGIWFGSHWLEKWGARAPYRNTAGRSQSFDVSDLGIGLAGPISDSRVGWSAVLRALETNEFFLFYVSENAALYLPKRAVGAADLEPLRGLLSKHLGKTAKLLAQAVTAA